MAPPKCVAAVVKTVQICKKDSAKWISFISNLNGSFEVVKEKSCSYGGVSGSTKEGWNNLATGVVPPKSGAVSKVRTFNVLKGQQFAFRAYSSLPQEPVKQDSHEELEYVEVEQDSHEELEYVEVEQNRAMIYGEKEGILMMSDTLGTDSDEVESHCLKIYVIRETLLAEVGDVVLGEMAALYHSTNEPGDSTVGDIAESLKNILKYIVERDELEREEDEVIDLRFGQYLLCGFEDGKPVMYLIACRIDEDTGCNEFFVDQVLETVYTLGSGSKFAKQLLVPQPDLESAKLNSSRAVCLAIEKDPFCGGEVFYGYVEAGKKPVHGRYLSCEGVELVIAEIKKNRC